jgi:CheY-like chemotaxis protein
MGLVNAFEILLVEDNPGDVRLTREALKEHRLLHNLSVVSDGEEALRFLRRQEPFVGAPRPDLILLDLNLPRVSGREVLSVVKGDPLLRSIPVVILTSSEAPEDVGRAYELQANCYVRKPVGFTEFGEALRSIDHFWLTVVTLPPR